MTFGTGLMSLQQKLGDASFNVGLFAKVGTLLSRFNMDQLKTIVDCLDSSADIDAGDRLVFTADDLANKTKEFTKKSHYHFDDFVSDKAIVCFSGFTAEDFFYSKPTF